jgi:hypothetical protein
LEIYNTFYSQNYEVGNDRIVSNGNAQQGEDIKNTQTNTVMLPSIILPQQQTQIPIGYDQQNYHPKY